jgi:hypothetical protein
MRLDWILNPFAQYGILFLGLLTCLGVCVFTSIRLRRQLHHMATGQETLSQAVTASSTAVEEIRRKTHESEVTAPASLAGLNLTKRAQALRMHRRGESVPTIAAALQSPHNEIDLLLKVHSYLNS